MMARFSSRRKIKMIRWCAPINYWFQFSFSFSGSLEREREGGEGPSYFSSSARVISFMKYLYLNLRRVCVNTRITRSHSSILLLLSLLHSFIIFFPSSVCCSTPSKFSRSSYTIAVICVRFSSSPRSSLLSVKLYIIRSVLTFCCCQFLLINLVYLDIISVSYSMVCSSFFPPGTPQNWCQPDN